MFGVSIWELLLTAVVALIVIKPEDLPRLSEQLGAFVNSLRTTWFQLHRGADRLLEGEMNDAEESSSTPPMEPKSLENK